MDAIHMSIIIEERLYDKLMKIKEANGLAKLTDAIDYLVDKEMNDNVLLRDKRQYSVIAIHSSLYKYLKNESNRTGMDFTSIIENLIAKASKKDQADHEADYFKKLQDELCQYYHKYTLSQIDAMTAAIRDESVNILNSSDHVYSCSECLNFIPKGREDYAAP